MGGVRLRVLLFAIIIAAFAVTAQAQYAITTLVTFGSSNGANPRALMFDADGNLFGRTDSDGSGVFLQGAIFEVAAGTHAFSNWSVPTKVGAVGLTGPLLMDASGNFFGTSGQGGQFHVGTVYEMSGSTHAVTKIADLGGANGSTPIGGVIADAAGNLYGTTQHGGPTDNGTFYKIEAGTNSVSTLLTFDGPNGRFPLSNIVADSGGNLYGTTKAGGQYLRGTVFKIAVDTHALTTLHSFDGNGSDLVDGVMLDAAGNIYGAARQGAINNDGVIYKLDAHTNVFTILIKFDGSNGAEPAGTLIADSLGNLYGVTRSGGANNLGTIFKIDAGSGALTTLITFDGVNGANPTSGLVADAFGNFYGTTLHGGANDQGTVFELSPVPEPSSMALLMLGAGGLLALRRKMCRG